MSSEIEYSVHWLSSFWYELLLDVWDKHSVDHVSLVVSIWAGILPNLTFHRYSLLKECHQAHRRCNTEVAEDITCDHSKTDSMLNVVADVVLLATKDYHGLPTDCRHSTQSPAAKKLMTCREHGREGFGETFDVLEASIQVLDLEMQVPCYYTRTWYLTRALMTRLEVSTIDVQQILQCCISW